MRGMRLVFDVCAMFLINYLAVAQWYDDCFLSQSLHHSILSDAASRKCSCVCLIEHLSAKYKYLTCVQGYEETSLSALGIFSPKPI